MLATGFILSSNLLDVCSSEEISSYLIPTFSEPFPPWLQSLCGSNPGSCKVNSSDFDDTGSVNQHTTNRGQTEDSGHTLSVAYKPNRQSRYPAGRECAKTVSIRKPRSDSRYHCRHCIHGEEQTPPILTSDNRALDMGNKCSGCCPCWKGYSKVGDTDPDDERTSLVRGSGAKMSKADYQWEQNIMDETIMKSGHVTHAVIVSFKDGGIRAAAPRGFNPDRKGIRDILRALKDIDTTGIAENGINLGSGTRVNTPGKLDAGKAIYGSDGKGGGATVFKSKECVLVVFYDSDPAPATRLASEVAEYMEEQGH